MHLWNFRENPFCDNGRKYPQGGFQGKHEEELVDAEQYFQACINDTGNN